MRRTYRRPKPKLKIDFYRTNEQIKLPEVRVIAEDEAQLGIMPTSEALAMAKEQELDLVLVFPKAEPPVVKITDYGRMKYQKEKQLQKQKSSQKKADVKDIRLSLRISPHDMEFRLNQAVKFLEKGHKLKIEIILRGREKQLKQKSTEIVNNFINKLKESGPFNLVEEQVLTRQANGFNIILVNKQ